MILSSSFEKNDELDKEETVSRDMLGNRLAVDFARDGVVLLPLVC